MNARERYLETMLFGKPDKVPFVPGGPRQSTRAKWYTQGLPEGVEWSRRLAAEEGIFTGISGGASFAVAMKVAAKAPKGSVLLVMLPDTGERYLSTPLFEGVPEDMTEEEIGISQSTPSAQMAAE